MSQFFGLKRDEWAYELKIRGENRSDFTNRQATQLLDAYSSDISLVDLKLNQSGELAFCKAKLAQLPPLVFAFDGNDASAEYFELTNRIAHLLRRSFRFTDALHRPQVESLIKDVEALDDALENKWQENRLVSASASAATQIPSRNNSTPKLIPIHQWKFTFDNHTSVVEFLERLEELCQSRNTNKTDLFNSASDLFTDAALLWYRANKANFYNWDQLVDHLK